MTHVLYVIACAAPPAREVTRLIGAAQEAGWDVCLLVTPSATRFIDSAALEKLTGHPVRSDYKEPGTPDVLPPPDAIIVAPATLNTVNKWGYGICDTLALGILVEAIGKGLPIVALPFTNRAHAAHPAFGENISKLRSWGVRVLYGPDVYPLHAPGTGSQHLDIFPWQLALESLTQMTSLPPPASTRPPWRGLADRCRRDQGDPVRVELPSTTKRSLPSGVRARASGA